MILSGDALHRAKTVAQVPILQRTFPPELSNALQRARQVHETIWQLGPEKGAPNSVRIHTFAGFLTTLFEHHDSILLLLGTRRNDATAFALARVLVEAFYRGLWVILRATDEHIDQIRTGSEPYPRFIDMTNAVDQQLGSTGRLTLDPPIWKALNGFTHTGLQQLSRRFNAEGDLVPNYPLDEVLQVLGSGTLLVAVMTQVFCVVIGRKNDGDHILESWKNSFGVHRSKDEGAVP